MNLAEVLLTALKDHGVKKIFGIPGDFALPFFKVVEESKILPVYYMSHEPSVGFAADAAARIHGNMSVAAVTYGAGGFNMVNPIASAYAEKSPVVVLSGGPGDSDKSTGLLVHHQAKNLNSQLEVYKEVTCDQVILNDPEQAPAQIARVLANCRRHSRPVYIEIPRDKVFAPCQSVAKPQPSATQNENALNACADAILNQIQSAKNPVLVAGVEIRRYGIEEQVAELARRLNIDVVTTLMGRGLLACADDIRLQGTYLGGGVNEQVANLVEKSDAPLLIGVTLTDNNFGLSGQKLDFRQVILAADQQCSMGYHVYADIELKALVEKLIEKLPADYQKQQPLPQQYRSDFVADDAPITPNDIACVINELFKTHGKMPIAADMGDCFFTTLDIEYTELVAPGFYATMGFGVPAGFGLQVAYQKRPIILVGDGAFQMTGWELLNAPRYGLNPIVIVFNNASWEMLRTFQPESGFNDLPFLEFAKIAEALGGKGHTATTRQALKQSLETAFFDDSCFHIIDAQFSKNVLSNTLSKFVQGFKVMRGDK